MHFSSSIYFYISPYGLILLDSVCNYTPFKPLYKYDKPDFGVFKIMDIPEDQFPHMKAVIYHGLEGEDRTLCRGELLIILRLMLGQLKKTRLLRHKVVPVSLSFSIQTLTSTNC